MYMRLCVCRDVPVLFEEFPPICAARSIFTNDVTVHNTAFEIEPTDNALCLVPGVKASIESFSHRDLGNGSRGIGV